MIRYYLMPLATAEINGAPYRAPKYLKSPVNPAGIQCNRAVRDYGMIDACLVAADVTDQQHAALVANNDVAGAPKNIDQPIGDNLDRVRAVLEAFRIPANAITTQHTFRQLLRYIAGLFLFAQTYHALHGEALLDSPAELNTTWAELSIPRRNKIVEAAAKHRYYVPAQHADWPLRRVLKHMADQWGNTPIHFGSARL